VTLNVIDILHSCQFFEQVSDAQFKRLAAMAKIRNFRKGQLIFQESEPCPGGYIVGAGMVRVFKRGPGGKEHVLHMVSPGNTFAEVAAIGGFDLPAAAQAVSKTSCVLLPNQPFKKLLDDDPMLCRAMMLGMTGWVRHFVSLMEDIVLRDAAGRIAGFLLKINPTADGSIKLPGLKRYVASHLNLTSETFSRTFRRLIDAGLITDAKNDKLKIIDRKSLARVAEGLFPRL
jgi:CRP/FNR family transcriptional regulator, dissimilatory nitrate respiration regulator